MVCCCFLESPCLYQSSWTSPLSGIPIGVMSHPLCCPRTDEHPQALARLLSFWGVAQEPHPHMPLPVAASGPSPPLCFDTSSAQHQTLLLSIPPALLSAPNVADLFLRHSVMMIVMVPFQLTAPATASFKTPSYQNTFSDQSKYHHSTYAHILAKHFKDQKPKQSKPTRYETKENVQKIHPSQKENIPLQSYRRQISE